MLFCAKKCLNYVDLNGQKNSCSVINILEVCLRTPSNESFNGRHLCIKLQLADF